MVPASVGFSALISGLIGIGLLSADLPASWIATKFGEKRAMALACTWDAAWLFVAFKATSLVTLMVAVLALGMSAAVFGLARPSP